MLTYGYILAGLPRHDKFNEAQLLLDRLLKGYVKDNPIFEKDGDITVVYHKNEDGNDKRVILKRNISESNIAVFSDEPIKLLRYGRFLFYVRDIIPMLLFFLLFYFPSVKFNDYMMEFAKPAYTMLIFIIGPIAAVIIFRLTERLLKNNRSVERVRFIQSGGIFSIIVILALMLSKSGLGDPWNFWLVIFRNTHFIEIVGGLMLNNLIAKFRGEERY